MSGIAMFGVILPGLAVFVPLWFQTGAPPSLRWRWVAWSGIGGPTLVLSGAAVYMFVDGGTARENVTGCAMVGGCMMSAGNLVTLIAVAGAIASLVVRWIRSRGPERRRLKWLVVPFAAFAIGVLAEFGGLQDSLVASAGLSGGLILIPVAIGVAILKYRLYDIDRIVSRTVAYAMVVRLLALICATGAVWVATVDGAFRPTSTELWMGRR